MSWFSEAVDFFSGKAGSSKKAASNVRSAATSGNTVRSGDINSYLLQGRKRGEELTGINSADVGAKRGEIRSKYEDILNAPSRGSSRVMEAGQAAQKNLRSMQGQQGVSGGMANLQRLQLGQDYATKAGDVRQNEYMNALNKLEQQYRGGAKDIMTAEGQYGALGVGAKPNPVVDSQGTSFICSKLKGLGLMSTRESVVMLNFMLKTAYRSSAFLYWYFSNMKEVVDDLDLTLEQWKDIKQLTVTRVMDFIKLGELKHARNRYIYECGQVARLGGIDMPDSVYEDNLVLNLPYFLAIFTKVQTWKWLLGYYKIKTRKRFRSVYGKARC